MSKESITALCIGPCNMCMFRPVFETIKEKNKNLGKGTCTLARKITSFLQFEKIRVLNIFYSNPYRDFGLRLD